MRADRLLSILLLLQVHRHMTARDLAKRLEVSERTIYRDVEALSMAGIPITAERGIHGGLKLLESYKTNLTGLNQAEIQALFLAQPTQLLNDLGLRQASEAALIKLFAALPSLSRRDAEYIRQRIHIDATGWFEGEEHAVMLPTLQDALWQERKLALTYQRGDGKIVEREVHPLGLVAKGRMWYFIAAYDDDVRTYRVSRILTAQICDGPCERPQDFDLITYWQQSLVSFKENLPRYPVRARICSEALGWVQESKKFVCIESEEADGWVICSLMFELEREACVYILGMGPQIEVLEPEVLRTLIWQRAEEIVGLYARDAQVTRS